MVSKETAREATKVESIHVDVENEELFSFPDWSNEELEEARDLVSDIAAYYPGYDLSDGMVVKENPNVGRCHYRDKDDTPENVLLIEVRPERKLESIGHEIGHDVLNELMPDLNGSQLLTGIFKELHADLNTLFFTDIEPQEGRHLTRNPDKNLQMYKGLSESFDPKTWDAQLDKLAELEVYLENDSWNVVHEYARQIAISEPHIKTVRDIQDFRKYKRRNMYLNKLVDVEVTENHIFYDNFADGNGEPLFTSIARLQHEMWGISQVMANTDLGYPEKVIEKARKRGADSKESIGAAISNSEELGYRDIRYRPTDVLKQTMSHDVSKLAKYLEEARSLTQKTELTPELVLSTLSETVYGDNYQVTIDYPHNMGGLLAEEAYEEGREPYEVLVNPRENFKSCRDRIVSHIDQNI